MRESIGSAFLVNLILVFMGVISALLIGSISYSKAYKAKDRIVYIIEKYDGYTDAAKKEITTSMGNLGYTIDGGSGSKCESIYKRKNGSKFDRDKLVHGANDGVSKYDYCVYKHDCTSSDVESGSCIATYYSVTTFMHFDIPLLGGILKFAVSGETSLVYDVIDN